MYGFLLANLCVSVWASAVQRRSYDVDGDGIADVCYEICEKPLTCLLADGSWTTIARDIQLHTTSATSDLTTSSSRLITVPTTAAPTLSVNSTTSDPTTSSSHFITLTTRAVQSTLPVDSTTAVVGAVSKDVSQSSSSSQISSTTNPSSTTKTTTSSKKSTSNKTTTTTTKKSTTIKTTTTTKKPTSTKTTTTSKTSSSSKTTTTTKKTSTTKTTSPSKTSTTTKTTTQTSKKSSTTKATTRTTTTSHKTTTTHKTSSTSKTTSKSISTTSSVVTGALPDASQFELDKGTKWTVEYLGNISYTGDLQKEKLGGDKCRTSKLGDKVIWNCGDMMCNGSVWTCGFSMGPAFYGTDSVMVINTTGITVVADNDFVKPWSGDEDIQPPFYAWGMDTSNVAAINSTHGVAYAWEIWRGGPDNSVEDRGNAVASVTLGDTKPLAKRVGPLLTGNDTIQLGLLAILRDGNYVYIYSIGGPTNIIVGRVPASDDVFDASKYEFLKNGTTDTWLSGIPLKDATNVALSANTTDGTFFCGGYGSITYNNYLGKYILLCDMYINWVTMYVSDTPYGPFSDSYQILGAGRVSGSYGTMMHPEFQPIPGTDRSWYFSLGPNGDFFMYKVTFDY